MTFNLKEEKWINLIKTLSKYRPPEINKYCINYVPSESKEVKEFMRNSIPVQKQFCFNSNNQTQIDCSKYFEELKLVASKTTDYFLIKYTNFKPKEFCEIVSAGKLCKQLNFRCSLIPLDSECDFGADMEGCIIERIDFDDSYASSYSNWKQYPERFENLIAAIAKCKPLSKSLKTLDFAGCEITKLDVEKVLKKYNLIGIALPHI